VDQFAFRDWFGAYYFERLRTVALVQKIQDVVQAYSYEGTAVAVRQIRDTVYQEASAAAAVRPIQDW